MSKYDRMKFLVFFDLPVETNDEKREYRLFRKKLLEEGFIMIQYSVYMRTCPNREFAKKFLPKLKIMIPSRGNIRTLMITEKQYQDMDFIVGSKKKQEIIVGINKVVII